ncbi:oxidoreductase [Actinoplanes sp. DH11]|uniref:WD40/YVTN/BNR-like repeat-containing protein n=1 Tax=Actinoplanes sp. DH11 TaxID=2857011 RepID=UPI001E5E3697|nr:oxidoreductase [Actinoplanes sp. DH11]
MTTQRNLSISALVLVMAAGTGWTPGHGVSWQLTDTGSTARFRGLAPVDASVAWAAGSAGTVLRTVDAGRTWTSLGPPAAAGLEFRDIEAHDARSAVALTVGTGTDSRIYTTTDAGRTWTETFRNEDPVAFYDCLAFSDHRRSAGSPFTESASTESPSTGPSSTGPSSAGSSSAGSSSAGRRHGLALSDPVDGKFRILATRDGGRTWDVVPSTGMPDALPGEFAFAASGTCLVSAGRDYWFATGGGATARVFHSRDGGRTWSVTDSPVPSGPSAGIYGLAFRDSRHGLAVGGDYVTPAAAPDGAAVTRDGGRHWDVSRRVPGAYRSGVTWKGHSRTAIAVGPTGSDISYDGGRTWRNFDTGSFDAVACTSTGACWASGQSGRIARLRH